jgi:hypothetical protein
MWRLLSSLLLCCVFNHTFSQQKLCEEGSIMYSKCFFLNEDKTFRYAFNHCTGSQLGIGTYTFSDKYLHFQFDTLYGPIIRKSKDSLRTNFIKVSFRGVGDNLPLLNRSAVYNNTVFESDSNGILFIPFEEGTIGLINFLDTVATIFLDPVIDQSNNYTIYWFDIFDTFCSEEKKIKMKKVFGKYRTVEKWLELNENRARKKKKKVIKYYSFYLSHTIPN